MEYDFRQLCADLLDQIDSLPFEYGWKGNVIGDLADLDFELIDRARAALDATKEAG